MVLIILKSGHVSHLSPPPFGAVVVVRKENIVHWVRNPNLLLNIGLTIFCETKGPVLLKKLGSNNKGKKITCLVDFFFCVIPPL